MKPPKFEVTQDEYSKLQLVSDAGHAHYKEAIEMLLASEMFVRHNLYLINFYRYGLAMIEASKTGEVELPEYAVTDWNNRFEPDHYLTVADNEIKQLKDIALLYNRDKEGFNTTAFDSSIEKVNANIKRLSEIIVLVKMAFHNKPQLIRNR